MKRIELLLTETELRELCAKALNEGATVQNYLRALAGLKERRRGRPAQSARNRAKENSK